MPIRNTRDVRCGAQQNKIVALTGRFETHKLHEPLLLPASQLQTRYTSFIPPNNSTKTPDTTLDAPPSPNCVTRPRPRFTRPRVERYHFWFSMSLPLLAQ